MKPNVKTVAEIELTYKSKVKSSDRPKISSSKDAWKLFTELYNENTIELREEFKLMFLNRSNRVLGYMNISTGSTSGTVVDMKIIVASACKAMASGVILCHNHPSGNEKPSEQDISLTRKAKEILSLIEISLLDHIIIIPNEAIFYSMSDEGEI